MDELRQLIDCCWINRKTDPQLYYRTKHLIPVFKKFVVEQIGWQLIYNERIIKLEKIPVIAKSYMGIEGFKEPMDYMILATLLIFLEGKEDYEQFLVSEMIEMMEIHMKEYREFLWSKFTHRTALVRVLRFVEKNGFLTVYEGSSSQLSGDDSHEILYENSGLSRYFATNFSHEISDFTCYIDFEQYHMKYIDEDRGQAKINRVYRQLVSTPQIYWKDNEDVDGLYIKNYRHNINKNLNIYLDGELQVHKNIAFCLFKKQSSYSNFHPDDTMLTQIVLKTCDLCRENICNGVWEKGADEQVSIEKKVLDKILLGMKEKYQTTWTIEYKKLEINKLSDAVIAYMEEWEMLVQQDDRLVIYPSVGKFIGCYPREIEDRLEKENE